ncbi:MAG: dihydrodipicolinate synthase family protein [Planctomycetales bacterium]
MAPKPLHGVLPIVHTPFDDDESIDYRALEREIDWAFETGADGFGTGMVSEVLRLTFDERVDLGQRLVEFARGRGAVFLSVGAESIRQAAECARHAERAGCDAVMAVPPVTSPLSEPGMLEYFRAIAEAVDVPVVVQDASGYVGQGIPLDVHLALLERYGAGKILFKPEAPPLGPNLSALRDATGGAARIFEGSGGIFLADSFRRGIAGTMPGMDLLDGIVALWGALQAGDALRADRLHFPIGALVALQMQAGLDGFLAIEKFLLVKRGVFLSARRRTPYRWELDPETATEVERLFEVLQRELRAG